jgi:hypothetical protein
LISTTIDETKDIPEVISETGKIGMPHKGMELQPLLSLHLFTDFPRRDHAKNRAAVSLAYEY